MPQGIALNFSKKDKANENTANSPKTVFPSFTAILRTVDKIIFNVDNYVGN